ncbi:MAG TPA: GNAT family N-acetyltransferase, partial [Rhodanobacteraceae bacterium]
HLAHKALIMGMYVRGDRQGRGIGRMLLQEVIALARSVTEIRQVNIIANAANGPAQKLYESLGFRAYGRELRSMRIHGEWYDEVLMSLDLGKD